MTTETAAVKYLPVEDHWRETVLAVDCQTAAVGPAREAPLRSRMKSNGDVEPL